MVKVYVAQTQDRDRDLVCEFLKSAGHDVQPYTTDVSSLIRLTWDIMPTTHPSVIVSSQRDMFGHPYISNMLQAVALNLPIQTLTVVYSRAAAHQEHMPGVVRFLADLVSTPKHQLKILPKNNEEAKEMKLLQSYINDFSPVAPAAK